jgi:hypothetical protein
MTEDEGRPGGGQEFFANIGGDKFDMMSRRNRNLVA